MSLWGKTDTANDAPNYSASADANNIFFVDTTEAGVAGNRAKGLKTPGWNKYTTYTDAAGNTRHKVEPLVALAATAGAAGDVGATEPFAVTSAVDGGEYIIVTAGDTDFTAIGAANSDVGVAFTANGAGTGTGTIRIDEDSVVADS